MNKDVRTGMGKDRRTVGSPLTSRIKVDPF
jgi:hypothetical protein